MLSQIANDEYLDMFDDDDTDSESSDSHDDDDISIVMTDEFATRKKTFSKKKNNEDLVTDFDKEMENELCDTINALESVRKLSASGKLVNTDILSATGSHQQTAGEGDPQSSSKDQSKDDQYDDIYFDSDEETEKKDAGNSLTDNKHKVLSNDELFYDPEMDKKDQMWMDKRRLNPHMFYSKTKKSKTYKKGGDKKLTNEDDVNVSLSKDTKRKKVQMLTNRRAPRSDAVLDCPACMTTLCIDCQKHATFPHQYRAMFVMNCTIDFTERFKYPRGTDRKKKRKVAFIDEEEEDEVSNMLSPSSGNEKDDIYYSVKCDECRTKVAMYDKDEIYHFFNVISSYG